VVSPCVSSVQSDGSGATDVRSLDMLLTCVAALRRIAWCKAGFDDFGTSAAVPKMTAFQELLRRSLQTPLDGSATTRARLRLVQHALLTVVSCTVTLEGPSKRNPVPVLLPLPTTVAPRSVSGSGDAAAATATPSRATATSTTAVAPADRDGSGATDGTVVKAQLGPAPYRLSKHERHNRRQLLPTAVVQLLGSAVGSIGIDADGSPCGGGAASLFTSEKGLARACHVLMCSTLLEVCGTGCCSPFPAWRKDGVRGVRG
jgi:hypothetical protein